MSLVGENVVSPMSTTSFILHTAKDANLQWKVIGNGKITNGQGSNIIKVKWDNVGSAVVKVKVSALNCTDSISLNVNILNCKLALAIEGLNVVESNSVAKYTVNLLNANLYNWEVKGGKIINGQGKQSIQIQWDSAYLQKNSIKVSVDKGICSGNAQIPVLTYQKSAKFINSTHFDTTCASSERVYSLPDLPYVTYQWNVHRGKISSGTGTNTIKVQFDGLAEDEVDILDAEVVGTMQYAGIQNEWYYPTYLKKNAGVSIKPAFVTNSICDNDSLLLEGICSEKLRNCGWTYNSVFSKDTTLTNYIKKAGKYQFKGEFANGCVMVSDIYTLKTQKCAANKLSLTTSPNPSTGDFTYTFQNSNVQNFGTLKMTIYNMAMIAVYSQSIGSAMTGAITLNSLQTGYYFIAIRNEQNELLAMTKLIVVQ
jgi:hypothetical protein